jgi:hypothetical protein
MGTQEQKIVTWMAKYNDTDPEAFADYLRTESDDGWNTHIIQPTLFSNDSYGPKKLLMAVIIFRKYEQFR